MKKLPIQELLYMTAQEYYDAYVALYMRWCMSHTLKKVDNEIDQNDLQKLISNTAVNKWFTERHQDLEYQAYGILRPQHTTITKKVARGIYTTIMLDIFEGYPRTLFIEARKLTLIGNQN